METMYVLVRSDMSWGQRSVQGGHAVAEYLLRHPRPQWRNGTMVYLAVSGEFELSEWEHELDSQNINYATFREPDLRNQRTALATVAPKIIFQSLRLL